MGEVIKITVEEYLINMLALAMGDDFEEDGIKKRNLNCFKAQQLIYLAMKQLRKKGIDLKIPYYWSANGVRLELNQLVEMYPNIIWTCREEEYRDCPFKIECDFTGKFRSGFNS